MLMHFYIFDEKMNSKRNNLLTPSRSVSSIPRHMLIETSKSVSPTPLRKNLPRSNSLPRKAYSNLEVNRSHTLPSPKKSSPLLGKSSNSLGSQLLLRETDECYSSTVSIPAYYTEQKQLQKGSPVSVLRKISGIPFAIVYGFLLYVILRYMVLSEPHKHPDSNYTSIFKEPKDVCSLNFTTNHNISRDEFKLNSHFSGHHRNELVYGIGTATIFVACASVFSRNTRSTMLLILPGLITGRSRTFLFTFVLGLLCNGPISSIRYNFNAIIENAGCTYESALRATCHNGRQANAIFKKFEEFFNEILIAEQKFKKIKVIEIKLNIDINPNVTWPNFQDMIKAPQMTEFKQQVDRVISQVSQILEYAHISGKSLTCISILLLIIDAVRYIRVYYSDSSFDNMFVTDHVRKLWSDKGYQDLIPLRHWELNKGFKERNSPKFTKREFYKSLHQLVPTIIMSLIAIMIISADILLSQTLRYIKDNDELTITFDGIHQNYTNDIQLDLPSYNISADTCLVPPTFTSENVYIIVSLVLLGAGVSCVLEVYLSRIRAQMCRIFYPDKELERADYLLYRIRVGRIQRKGQLTLVVRRELERRRKLVRFSPLARLKKLLSCCKKEGKEEKFIVCPACGWKEKHKYSVAFLIQLGDEEEMKTDRMCSDCFQDHENNLVDEKMIVASKKNNYGACN